MQGQHHQHPTLYQTYAERSEHPSNTPLATYLLRLIQVKRTNLCVSADVYSSAELLRVAEEVGEHICVLKTHADTVRDFTDRTASRLEAIARKRKFVIFEDRKFADIGSTVEEQYAHGNHSIVQWAPIVNAHTLPGPDIITSLARAAQKSIAQYNTSVSTDISASPAASVNNDTSSVDASGTDDDYPMEEAESYYEDEDEEYDEEDVEEDSRYNYSRDARKQSVVSVSTTISMKSETMSPPPTIRPSLSRNSTASDPNNTNSNSNSGPNSSNITDALRDITNNNNSNNTNNDSTGAADGNTSSAAALPSLADFPSVPFYRALLLIAEMSSKGNLLTPSYTSTVVSQARSNRDFVMGFIAQRSLNSEPDDNFITMTPGVQLEQGGDGKGQQYNTPRKIVTEAGADVVIVGRGVLGAQDRRKAAAEYRRVAWEAYEERIRGRGSGGLSS